MKKYAILIMIVSLMFGASSHRLTKTPAKQMRILKSEPVATQVASENDYGPITRHDLRNGSSVALVDSSQNGYGMVSSTTRPLYVGEEGWFMGYRQFWAPGESHGRLGAAYSDNGSDWTIYPNINGLLNNARYPSVVGTPDYPYVFWNEYTGNGNGYGGQFYYAYDEFGWDGGSFTNPFLGDLAWFDDKDQWVGSIAYAIDSGSEKFLALYDDWFRDGYFLFTTEAYEDGFVVFGEEYLILDEAADMVGGTEDGSYNSSAIITMNDDGIAYAGLIGIFSVDESGLDCDPAVESGSNCYHTPIFKMSTDYGDSWGGNGGAYYGDYHHVPNNVWEHMIENSFTDYMAACEGDTSDALVDMWTYYNYDLKVDSDGDPHILVEVLPCGDEYCYYSNGDGSTTGAGWYHLTIDKDNLSNPGAVNSTMGWNYSYVVDARDTWAFAAPDGDSYLWGTHASLAFSKDNSDIVWVVADMAVKGDADPSTVDESDPNDCNADAIPDSYPEWSEEILVFKSEDNGASWWNPLNATNTPDQSMGTYSPEEQYPHAYHWGTDDQVYFMFQMPDWLFNEIGDPMGADHKNRVYAGLAEVTGDTEPEYPGGGGCALLGDVNLDGFLNILDIVGTVNFILGTGTIASELCADFNEDGFVNILDIVATVNCILGTGPCGGSLARAESNVNAVLVGNKLDVDSSIGGLQFKGELISELIGSDVITSANGRAVIYNPIDGELSTTSFEFSSMPAEVIVASVQGADIQVNIAKEYLLMNSYPNPFNPETTISYELTQSGSVDLAVYNMRGQKVSTLINGFVEAGNYKAVWNGLDANGTEMPSGIYMLQLTSTNNSISEKVTLLR